MENGFMIHKLLVKKYPTAVMAVYSVQRTCMSISYCLPLFLTRVLCLDHTTNRDRKGQS